MLVQGVEVARWVASQFGNGWAEPSTGIGVQKDGKLIAGIMICEWNGASCCAHIACTKVTSEFRTMLFGSFNYMFRKLGVAVVIGQVAASNTKCKKLVRKIGFKEVATIPDAFPDGALIIYTLTAKDCRYL